jgi:hypothetical protein
MSRCDLQKVKERTGEGEVKPSEGWQHCQYSSSLEEDTVCCYFGLRVWERFLLLTIFFDRFGAGRKVYKAGEELERCNGVT